MLTWLLQNLIGILGIVIGGFIAYHVYFLSKKIGIKDTLVHKDGIRQNVQPILMKIGAGLSNKVELINIKKYLAHYPHNNKKDRHGYTYLGAELKALRFDGIEFFCGVRNVYKKSGGTLTLNQEVGSVQESYNIFEVGLIPYEWIEYVDTDGDEFSYRPQFFTNFKGHEKSPYRYLVYYKKSDVYHEDGDPIDMKWQRIDVN